MLQLKISDLIRATLSTRSGNEGWIGVSPKGDDYHVVVPVDVQIARGVMACNRPTDGTPFGGYAGRLYFRCPPYEDDGCDDEALREEKARETGARLVSWLASYEIEAQLHEGMPVQASRTGLPDEARGGPAGPILCSGCGKSWRGLSELIRDPGTRFKGYRACSDDFDLGRYVFSHVCGTGVEVPVTRFARIRHGSRSLIGTHACPGLCYYETSLRGCSAECEGSIYRRIAGRLGSRRDRGEI
ncbi:MAG: hypothetical protein V1792_15450 [Pseudomonadota bacterium]